MGMINILPQSVAELIAAGEVVDRPASIVKELVENALDAGADRISVEIKNGGIGYIRVSDNGCGISADDIPVAFIRHATSKISEAADLDSIATLGFRGEALPSVAAVSRVKVTSRTEDEKLGSCFYIDGSGKTEQTECGCSVGTVIEVRDLFYNTPARMKFLKKDVTEGNAVASLLDRLALANPSVSFELIREGKRTLQTAGDGKLISAVRMICGAEVAAGMIPVNFQRSGITVSGVISKPSIARTTRSLQTFFINSRYVRSKTCAAAVEESYKNRMMTGRFPACILNLDIDCGQVDVNVHPAKLEVRFSDERLVYNTVYSACIEALVESEQKQPAVQKSKINYFSINDFDHSDRQLSITASKAAKPKYDNVHIGLLNNIRNTAASMTSIELHDDSKPLYNAETNSVKAKDVTVDDGLSLVRTNRRVLDIECDETVAERMTVPCQAAAANSPHTLKQITASENPQVDENIKSNIKEVHACKGSIDPTNIADAESIEAVVEPYRIIGELFDTYILIEQSDRFILIDKHAAHERYIYNNIKHLEKGEDRQILLVPQAVTLARDEYFALQEHLEALEMLGISAEDFGEQTILVREIPMLLDGFSLNELLGEVAQRILSKKNTVTPELLDELLYNISCRAAVMAGRKSSMPELQVLADMVLGDAAVRYCPHGRPVMTVMSRREVEKTFGRMG